MDQRMSYQLTKHLYSKAGKMHLPLSGTFELSPLCNFSCKMCYVRKSKQEVDNHPRKMMTYDEWVNIAKQARDKGLLYLLLTGGEPLLWPDFWKLYEKLYYMGFLLSINTNGSMIDDEAIAKFKKMPPQRINITLYGASDGTYFNLCQTHNVFTRVTTAIEKLVQAGINVKLNCSLTPENAGDLEKIVSFAKKYNLILMVATYMFPPVRRNDSLIGVNERFTPRECAYYHTKQIQLINGDDEYSKFLRGVLTGHSIPLGLDESCIDPIDGRIRCRAGTASFWITWDGYITPCGMMPEPRIDLKNKDFSHLWEELVDISTHIHTSGVCEKCKNQDICHSCAAMAYAETGKHDSIPKYLCEMVTEIQKMAQEEIQKL